NEDGNVDLQLQTAHPGFAVTVARNILTNAGGHQTYEGLNPPTTSAIAIEGNDTYPYPTFVDTVVANNDIRMVGLPVWATLTQLGEGVSNGLASLPYPQGTVVCRNTLVGVTTEFRDCAPQPSTCSVSVAEVLSSPSSTLTTCPAP